MALMVILLGITQAIMDGTILTDRVGERMQGAELEAYTRNADVRLDPESIAQVRLSRTSHVSLSMALTRHRCRTSCIS